MTNIPTYSELDSVANDYLSVIDVLYNTDETIDFDNYVCNYNNFTIYYGIDATMFLKRPGRAAFEFDITDCSSFDDAWDLFVSHIRPILQR